MCVRERTTFKVNLLRESFPPNKLYKMRVYVQKAGVFFLYSVAEREDGVREIRVEIQL